MRSEAWILFAAMLLLQGCVGMKMRATMENSDWYRGTLQYVQSEENHIINSTELWCGQVSSTEDEAVYLKEQSCLRSVVRAWYGGYCNQSHDVPGRFSLSHQYLDTPLRKGDFIVFAAIHGLKGSHSIIQDRIARVEQDSNNYKVIPLKFDHAAYSEGRAREKALNKLYDRDIETVEAVLKSGLSPNTQDEKRNTTAFHHRLSYLGEPEILKLFIRYGADVNAVDGTGRTPLGIAAVNLHCPIILCRILLEAGADPNINPNQDKVQHFNEREVLPPLFAAAQRGNIELMQLLIEHGADPGISVKVPVSVPLGIKIPDCVTPLSEAVSHKQPQAIRFLLGHGAKASEYDQKSMTEVLEYEEPLLAGEVIMRSQFYFWQYSRLKRSLEYGFSPDIKLPSSSKERLPESLLAYAAKLNCIDIVVLLLEYHASDLDNALQAALESLASDFGPNYTIARKLLAAGANPDHHVNKQETILSLFENTRKKAPNYRMTLELLRQYSKSSGEGL